MVFLLLTCTNLVAQNDLVNFSFDNNRALFNPATPDPEYLTHDGLYRYYIETLFSREQVGQQVGESPYQGSINFQWYPRSQHDAVFRWKFGSTIFIDDFGPTEMLFIQSRVSIQWFSPKGDMLAAGMGVGYQHQRIDLSNIEFLQFGDPLAQANFTNPGVDLGLGLFFNKRIFDFHDIFLGVSVPHLFVLNETGSSYETTNSLSLLMGANIYYSDFAYLEPTVQVHTHRYEVFNLRTHFRKPFWIGGGYDSRGLVSIEAGIRLRNLIDGSGLKKSGQNYWRFGLTYRFWSGNSLPVFGNMLGFKLAYIGK